MSEGISSSCPRQWQWTDFIQSLFPSFIFPSFFFCFVSFIHLSDSLAVWIPSLLNLCTSYCSAYIYIRIYLFIMCIDPEYWSNVRYKIYPYWNNNYYRVCYNYLFTRNKLIMIVNVYFSIGSSFIIHNVHFIIKLLIVNFSYFISFIFFFHVVT